MGRYDFRRMRVILLTVAVMALLCAAMLLFLRLDAEDYDERLRFVLNGRNMRQALVSAWDAGEEQEDMRWLFLPQSVTDLSDVTLDCDEDMRIHVRDAQGQETVLQNGDTLEMLQTDTTYEIRLESRGNPFDETIRLQIGWVSDLPSVCLALEGSVEELEQVKGKKERAAVRVLNEDGSCNATGTGKVRIHGNTSWYDPKHSFNITLDDPESLLGMGEQSKWILVSNYGDASNMLNMTAYTIQREAGCTYAPECRYVNLYVNDQYQGLYLLIQKIDIDGGCVHLTNLEEANKKGTPEDITGGYLMELCGEKTYEEGIGFTTKRRYVALKSPNNATDREIDYIDRRVTEAENALYSEDETAYLDYFDEGSFALQYLLQEFMINGDTELNSEYIWLDAGGENQKIHAGPGWDFDRSLWHCTEDGTAELHSLHVRGLKEDLAPDGQSGTRLWLPQLETKESFQNTLKDLYLNTFSSIAQKVIEEDIPRWAEETALSSAADDVLWRYGDGSYTDRAESVRDDLRTRKEFLDEWFTDPDQFELVTTDLPGQRYNLIEAVPIASEP